MKLLSSLVFIVLIVSVYPVPKSGFKSRKRHDSEYKIQLATHGEEGKYYEPSDNNSKQDELRSYGGGLRTIALGSAHQAHSAVASQNAAAQQAAYVVKNTLAQSALQSAATANAALAGKEVLLEAVEKQTSYAHQALEAEIAQLEIAKKSTSYAKTSAEQAKNHVAILTAALNSAETLAQQAEHAANEADRELTAQTDMVTKAKSNLKTLEHRLLEARVGFDATKEATRKATLAAEEAQKNADKAASQASYNIHQSYQNHQSSALQNSSSEEFIHPVSETQNEQEMRRRY